MQTDGLIAEDAAPAGTMVRRARRVYQLTDTGKQRFTELVADTGPQNYTDDGFGVHLAFSIAPRPRHGCASSSRRRQVEERREGLREAIARASNSLDRYTRQLHQLGLESSEREVKWLNDLIAAERSRPCNRREVHVRRTSMTNQASNDVRVAIVGVGNCASSLVQGVQYYKDADPNSTVPGLMHVTFGQYHVRDVKFVAAFDVDAKKVGFNLPKRSSLPRTTPSRSPTCRRRTSSSSAARPSTASASTTPTPSSFPTNSRSTSSRCSRTTRSTCWCRTCRWVPKRPTSSTRSAQSMPGSRSSMLFRCSSPPTPSGPKFEDAGVPIVGDDIKSQVGATITHRVMAKLFEDRGVTLDRTYQLNVGGNMDFKNMLERERLGPRRSQDPGRDLQPDRFTGRQGRGQERSHRPVRSCRLARRPQGAYVRLRSAFGDVPLNLEYKLEVWTPQLGRHHHRCGAPAKIAKDRGIGGPIIPASAYLMKSPRNSSLTTSRAPSSKSSLKG